MHCRSEHCHACFICIKCGTLNDNDYTCICYISIFLNIEPAIISLLESKGLLTYENLISTASSEDGDYTNYLLGEGCQNEYSHNKINFILDELLQVDIKAASWTQEIMKESIVSKILNLGDSELNIHRLV